MKYKTTICVNYFLKNYIMNNETLIETLVNVYAAGNNKAFAKMLGVSSQTISNWKRNERHPDLRLIYTKCENLSGDWLLSGEGEIFRTPDLSNKQTASANGKRSMAAVIRDINVNAKDDGQTQRIALLEQLLEEKERLIQVLLSQKSTDGIAK